MFNQAVKKEKERVEREKLAANLENTILSSK